MHKRLFLRPEHGHVETHDGVIEEREQFTKQQRDAHGISLLRVQRQVRVVAFYLAHSRLGQRKLQAGTGEEPAFAAIVQHSRDLRRGGSDPVEPRALYQFARKGHDGTPLYRSQFED